MPIPSMEILLLVIGVFLLLVGLAGQVKAKEIEVGTKSKIARVVISIVGVVFIYFALDSFTKAGKIVATPTVGTAVSAAQSTVTDTPMVTPSFTPTASPTATPTMTPTLSPTPTETPSPTFTPTPTATATAAPVVYKAQVTTDPDTTLSYLALKYYGCAYEPCWRVIYEANKDVIGDNPSHLHPGMLLKIPVLP